MKLGIICHANFGGSGVIATELGLAFAARGHDVHFICEHAPPRLVAAQNVTLHEVKAPAHPLFPQGEYALALASKLAEVVGRHGLDLLHVHYAIPLAISAHLARELLGNRAPKLVVTVHGTDVLTLGQDPAFKPIVRHALLHSDAITAPSRFLAKAAHEGFELGDKPVEVVSNFVDTRRFAPAARSFTPKTLTHNSNFRSLKRVQDVVRIFERVRREVPCELVLIGDGPERAAVEALVHASGLQAHVRFLGEVVDVVPWLQRSDVFLMPSEIESFGLAALEAMSCGVPVVASRTGGLPEVITHASTGFLHPVGDLDAMAQSTTQLLQDAALHRQMSLSARAACLERFELAPIADTWEALYRRLLRNPT